MKKSHYILLMIFAAVLAARLIIAFQTPYFTGAESYFALRQAEHISHTGLPILRDNLSYEQRNYVFTPFFYYLLAFFDFIMPIGFVGKIIPNVLASMVIFFTYLISKEVSSNENAALFSAFISGFIPVFFGQTVNTVSNYSLFFPLLLFSVYCFLRIRRKNYAHYFLAALLLLVLTSPAVILLILGLVIYLFLVRLEDLRENKTEVELTIFSIVFVTWLIFIIFKNALLTHGLSVIYQNIPAPILNNYFKDISVLGAIYSVGSLPISYGVYSIYENLFEVKNRKMNVLIGFAFSASLLSALKLVEVSLGLICIGMMATLLFPKFYTFTFDYLKKTRFASLEKIYFIILLLAFVGASVIPSLMSGINSVSNSLTEDEYTALQWLNNNTGEDSVILTSIQGGALIPSIAQRKSVGDTRFLLQKNAEQLYDDINTIYTSRFETPSLGLMKKYGIDYIYVSERTKKNVGFEDIKYISDERCFSLVYDQGVKIYKVECELK